jgi:hypothetical protein
MSSTSLPSSLPPAPRPVDADTARRLRDAAARAEFDGQIFRYLGVIGSPGWRASMREKWPKMVTFDCGTLVRLFIVRDPVPETIAAGAVGGGEVLTALVKSGILVGESGGMVRCPFQLTPAAGVLVLTDAIDDPASANPPDDYVIPVSGAARGVDDLTPREPCDLVIDLACGQGFHALRSMTHAKRCIATDINARALDFARANASLLGASDRIDIRQGSFFEPVADVVGKVDLLTCNPPFVMQPGAHITSAVSPTEGDGMVEGLVRGLPRMLREGAWGVMSGLWENAEPRDWSARVREWLAEAGCDALVLQFQTYLPEEYLTAWFPPEVRVGIEPGWRALCEKRRIGAVTYGAVIVRKRAGQNWLATLSTPIFARTGAAGEQIKAYFASQTAMQNMWGPVDLLDRRLRFAAGWRFDPAQGTPKSTPLGVSRGLALPVPNQARWEPVLTAFDGGATARETLAQIRASGRLNVQPDHPETAAMLQGMVQSGCLDILS